MQDYICKSRFCRNPKLNLQEPSRTFKTDALTCIDMCWKHGQRTLQTAHCLKLRDIREARDPLRDSEQLRASQRQASHLKRIQPKYEIALGGDTGGM